MPTFLRRFPRNLWVGEQGCPLLKARAQRATAVRKGEGTASALVAARVLLDYKIGASVPTQSGLRPRRRLGGRANELAAERLAQGGFIGPQSPFGLEPLAAGSPLGPGC